MIPSERCVDFVAAHEGIRYEAYQDQGGVWTLGYGHTRNVKRGDIVNHAVARLWLQQDLLAAGNVIDRLAPVPLTQNQYDALCSLCFNIGAGNMAQAHHILDPLHAGDYQKAADGFLLWDHIGQQVNLGLLKRRQDERELFLDPVEVVA